MARRTYTEDFRIAAVKQVTENGYEIADTTHSIMQPFFKTTKSIFLIPPHYDTDCNSFPPRKPKLLI